MAPQVLQRDGALARQRAANDHPATGKAGFIDLFAGIGCVARGFERTNRFEALALVDIDLDARRNWQRNHSHVDYLADDIAELEVTRLLECADGRLITGVVGCPPCQGFSAAGRRRADDERNRLLASFFDVVRRLAPRFFVMENVPAILRRDELRAQEEALEGRYAFAAGLVNAALHGVPQARERAVVIGIDRELDVEPTLPPPSHLGSGSIFSCRLGEFIAPTAENLDDALGSSPQIGARRDERFDVATSLPDRSGQLADLVTVWDAIGDLPSLESGRSVAPDSPSDYAISLGAGEVAPYNHVAWGHAKETVARLRSIPEGGRLSTERRYYSQAYTRLHRRGLARTITTNFHNAGSGRFTHPVEARTITVREAARLQGIPDAFSFVGHGAVQERLVGNAFPPPLAESIAGHLASQLDGVGGIG